jgi:hypothetical protein
VFGKGKYLGKKHNTTNMQFSIEYNSPLKVIFPVTPLFGQKVCCRGESIVCG